MKHFKNLKQLTSSLLLVVALFAPQAVKADNISLSFDDTKGKNAVNIEQVGDNEYTIQITGADPYCALSAVPRDLQTSEHYFTYEYQSDVEISNEIEFFFNPFRGGKSINTGGIYATKKWTKKVVDIADAFGYTDYPWGGEGSYMRFDFGNGTSGNIKVRNLTITDDPNASDAPAVEYFEISNTADLQAYADQLNDNPELSGKLTADVVAPADLMLSTSSDFRGIFDGQGHKITLNQNRAGDCSALFRGIDGSGVVKNLVIDGTIIANGKYAGAVTSYQHGTVENVVSLVDIKSNVNGDGTHGGLFGIAYSNSVTKNCVFAGTISGEKTDCCGGLIGWTDGSPAYVQNCLQIGEITVGDNGSATFGRNSGNISMSNCYYLNKKASVHSAAVQITADQLASGEVCFLLNGDQSELVYTQAIGTATYPMPLAGEPVYCNIADGKASYSNVYTVHTHDYSNGATCSICGAMSQDFCEIVKGAYQIGNVEQYKWFAYQVNNKGHLDYDAVLTGDIDLSNEDIMLGISGHYTGTFDGNGHTITVGYNRSGADNAALFSTLEGTVKNLVVAGTINISSKYAAGVAAHTYGSTEIENVVSLVNINTTISGDGTHAGIVAVNESGAKIKNCVFAGSITGSATTNCGGIVGWSSSHSDIDKCLMVADINIGSGDNHVWSRNSGNATITNSYYTATYPGAGVAGTEVTAEQVANGEVGYTLGWYQTLGKDAYPNPIAGSAIVDNYDGTYTNDTTVPRDEKGVYQISNARELVLFSQIVNSTSSDAKAVLTADIDLARVDNFTPIGLHSDDTSLPRHTFTGSFDGQGHVIKNLTIVRNDKYETGLFSRCNGAVLANFGVVNASVTNTVGIRTGVICGDFVNCGVIKNIFTVGDIKVSTSHAQCAGIAAETYNTSKLTNCYTSYEKATNYTQTSPDNVYEGEVVAKTMATGELAYKLNAGNIATPAWRQTLGKDAYPVLSETSAIVYMVDGAYTNEQPAWAKLAQIIAASQELSASVKSYEALITETSQFSCNCVWDDQGSLDNLLDGDTKTYVHSTLNMVYDGSEYLQVALNEPVSAFTFELTGRGDGLLANAAWHDTPRALCISASNDGENWTEIEPSLNLGLPNTHNAHYASSAITMPEAYKYVRFGILGSTSGQPYWNISEFQMYSTQVSKDSPYLSISGLQKAVDNMDRIAASKQELVDNQSATDKDVNTMQTAYDKAKGILDGTYVRIPTEMPELSTPENIQLYRIKNIRSGKYVSYAGNGTNQVQTPEASDASLYYFVAAAEATENIMPVKIYNVVAGAALNEAFTDWGVGATWYVRNDLYATGLAFGKSAARYGNNDMYWNDWSQSTVGNWNANGDAGSVWLLEEAEIPASMNVYTVNYNAEGKTIYSAMVATTAEVSQAMPAYTSLVSSSTEGNVVTNEVKIAAPFTASTVDDPVWYYMKQREIEGYSHYVRGWADGFTNMAKAPEGRDYLWAFVGDPFNGYSVINCAAGKGNYWVIDGDPDNGSAPVMSKTPMTWNLAARDAKVFGLGTQGFYCNGYGGGDSYTLRLWQSGPTGDTGSTLTVEPVSEEIGNMPDLAIAYDPASSEESGENYSVSELSEFHITLGGAYSVALADSYDAEIKDIYGKKLANATVALEGNVVTVTLDKAIEDQTIAVFTLSLKGLIVDGKPFNQVLYAVYYISGRGEHGNDAPADAINAIMADGSADIYSVNGTLVKKNATASDLKSLKGVYIIKGQKFMVK